MYWAGGVPVWQGLALRMELEFGARRPDGAKPFLLDSQMGRANLPEPEIPSFNLPRMGARASASVGDSLLPHKSTWRPSNRYLSRPEGLIVPLLVLLLIAWRCWQLYPQTVLETPQLVVPLEVIELIEVTPQEPPPREEGTPQEALVWTAEEEELRKYSWGPFAPHWSLDDVVAELSYVSPASFGTRSEKRKLMSVARRTRRHATGYSRQDRNRERALGLDWERRLLLRTFVQHHRQ